MRRIPISLLERYSDIKPHTIRTWETRHGLLNPERSTGNTRYYSTDDLERLLDVALLVQHGKRISPLSKSNDHELKEMIRKLPAEQAKLRYDLNRLIICLYKMDVEGFEWILSDSVARVGYSVTIHRLIVPFLEKADILSYKESDAGVHFAVTAVRKKLLVGIDQLLPHTTQDKKALLFLPENEHYDLMLLYVCYVLKSNGVKVYYLGTNVPEKNLRSAVLSKSPDNLYVYCCNPKNYSCDELITFLNSEIPGCHLNIITGEISNVSFSGAKMIHFTSFIE